MAFLVRTIHVGSASFMLGGAILLIIAFLLLRHDQSASTAIMLKLMQAYEYGFWAAIGLIVATGVGNIAHFGDALPGPETTWGQRFTIMLALVGLLMAVSAVRAFSLHLLTASPSPTRVAMSLLEGLYG